MFLRCKSSHIYARLFILGRIADEEYARRKANYMVWPAVQLLNFRVIPLQFQLVSLLLNLYL